MAKPLLDDQLWNVIAPLLPPAKPRRVRWPGPKPLVPRQVLTGILFVLLIFTKVGLRQAPHAGRTRVRGLGADAGAQIPYPPERGWP